MSDKQGFDYGRLMKRALRGLMAEVLGEVAEHGLPGGHHFYIGIDTTHPGVDMPVWLREAHPEQMTIVLQEWFADLAVLSDRFTVTLNFNNRPETLVVPFDAVETFIDPSAKFGLKFDDYDADEDGARFGADGEATVPDETRPETPQAETEPGADVVSLDSFRKS